jgi:sec-independent protein translocase protein TatA
MGTATTATGVDVLGSLDSQTRPFIRLMRQHRSFKRMIEGLLRPQHLLVILVVVLFVFGGKKLPEVGKGLGEGIKHFRESFKQGASDTGDKSDLSSVEKS